GSARRGSQEHVQAAVAAGVPVSNSATGNHIRSRSHARVKQLERGAALVGQEEIAFTGRQCRRLEPTPSPVVPRALHPRVTGLSDRAGYAAGTLRRQDQLVQSQQAVANLIGLYEALGGGWETTPLTRETQTRPKSLLVTLTRMMGKGRFGDDLQDRRD